MKQFFMTKRQERVKCIFHYIGSNVLQHKNYQEWMNQFPEDTQHIILSQQTTAEQLTFQRSAGMQQQLVDCHPQYFHEPFHGDTVPLTLDQSMSILSRSILMIRFILM
jgi:hypothetical protein